MNAFTLSTVGIHQIEYWSEDSNGAVETHKFATIDVGPGSFTPGSGNVLFWNLMSAPPDTFVSGYAGEWNGKIYCFGGFRTATSNPAQSAITEIYEYDPANGTYGSWSTNPNGWSVNPTFATSGGGFVQLGSKVYVFGGKTSTGVPPTDVIWSLDLSNGATAYEGLLTGPRTGSGAAVVGTYAYVVGGSSGSANLNTIECVNLASTPGTLAGTQMALTLTNPVTRPVVFSDISSVYIFGGLISSLPTPNGTLSNQALRFAPSTPPAAVWMPTPAALPYPRQGSHLKAMSGGFVYLTSDALSNEVLEYNMALDQWAIVGSQPRPLSRAVSLVDAAGTTVYDINGVDKTTGALYNILQAGKIVQATAVGATQLIPGANTNASVSAGGVSVSAVFDNVTNSNAQLCLSVLPTTGLPGPAGIDLGSFRIQGQVYEIATTAEGFTSVQITVPYTGTRVPVVRHYTGSWVPITVEWPSAIPDAQLPGSPYAADPWLLNGGSGGYPNHTAGNGEIVAWGSGTVTFNTPTLSPFFVEEAPPVTPPPTPTVSTPASSSWSLALGALCLMALTGALTRKRLRV